MRIYLVQRGRFKDIKDPKEITGLDSIIDYDYMGAAEFEFGGLGRSLARIMRAYYEDTFIPWEIKINDVPFWVFLKKEKLEEIEDIIKLFDDSMKGEYPHLKGPLRIEQYFEGTTISRLKRNCKKKREEVPNWSYMDFWWDIDNDWFVIPYGLYYSQTLLAALKALKDKKWLEKRLEKKYGIL